MHVFSYEAFDEKAKVKKGTLMASSLAEARQNLYQRQLSVIKIKQVEGEGTQKLLG